MKQLLEVCINFGRMGAVEGRFVCTSDEWEVFKRDYAGQSIWLSDYLGKHSECEIEIDKLEPKVVTDNREFLRLAEELGIDLDSGFNPLAYVDELDEQREDEEE